MWLRAFRALAEDECLAPYSLNSEEMTTNELRSSASRPYRLQNSILNNHNISLISEKSVLAYHSENDSRSSRSAWRFDPVLLPGGRWLLDCSVDATHQLYAMCWDTATFHTEGCYPIAEIPLQLDIVLSWTQQASEDSMKVTVLLNGTDTHDDWSETFFKP